MNDFTDAFVGTPEERVATLVDLLSVEKVAHDIFRGPRMPDGVGRIYGGQVIAQALAAAQETVEDARVPHSLHAYFLRGGDEDYPIDLRVARDFDGRSFSNRRVIASQNGVPILNLASSFQIPANGDAPPRELPDIAQPEDLPDELELFTILTKGSQPPRASGMMKHRSFEVRVPEDLRERSRGSGKPVYFWYRMLAPLPDHPAIHQRALSYLSDYGLLLTASIEHELDFMSGKARIASLDHALWFHQHGRMDDWVAYVTDSPWAGNARGFTRGHFYTRDGTLIASAAQEGMIRDRATHVRGGLKPPPPLRLGALSRLSRDAGPKPSASRSAGNRVRRP